MKPVRAIRHLVLAEGAPSIGFDLSDAEAEALDTTELAVVSRHPGGRRWEVAAGTKVGVATVGELQVIVRPKVPIDRLVFMMGYARDTAFWRNQSVFLDPDQDLPASLADAFRRQAIKALEQGCSTDIERRTSRWRYFAVAYDPATR